MRVEDEIDEYVRVRMADRERAVAIEPQHEATLIIRGFVTQEGAEACKHEMQARDAENATCITTARPPGAKRARRK